MTRKMTVVFHDEGLYTDLKVEAIRRRKTASDIVAEAVREWLERREDAELLPAIAGARAEWQKKGGRPWEEVEREIRDRGVDGRAGSCGGNREECIGSRSRRRLTATWQGSGGAYTGAPSSGSGQPSEG